MRTPIRLLVTAGLAALLIGLTANPSRAAFAYGVTYFGDQLIAVDTTTGAGSLVGPLDASTGAFGLASVNNQLYTFDSTNDVIRQISATTGGTLATYDVGIGPVLGQGGLAFQTATVGYLTSALDPTTLDPTNNLYRFDLGTGTSTLVAHTSDTLEALAFNPAGMLYGLGKLDGNLYAIDPSVGSMRLIGNTGVVDGGAIGGLTFAPDGTLYATINDSLYTLNSMTGAATAVGDPMAGTGFASISGLAFTDTSFSTVPEPSSALLLGLGVLGPWGVAILRRRRADRPAPPRGR